MWCTWNAGHMICMISLTTRRTVDVRKAGKMVMKSKIVFNMTNKTHIKNVRIFDHEKKNWIEKNAKPLSHYIFKYMLHRIIVLFVLQALLLLYFPKFEAPRTEQIQTDSLITHMYLFGTLFYIKAALS